MTTPTSPLAILRRLASGELSPTEARLALEGIPHASPSTLPHRPQRKRKPIGKRSKPTPVEWEKPITTWEDVTERFQYALRYAPTQDPWTVFQNAQREYHALTR